MRWHSVLTTSRCLKTIRPCHQCLHRPALLRRPTHNPRADRAATEPGCEASAELAQLYTSQGAICQQARGARRIRPSGSHTYAKIKPWHSRKPNTPCEFLRHLSTPTPAGAHGFMKPNPPRTRIKLEGSAHSRQAHEVSRKRPRHERASNTLRASGQPGRHLEYHSHASSAIDHAAILQTRDCECGDTLSSALRAA